MNARNKTRLIWWGMLLGVLYALLWVLLFGLGCASGEGGPMVSSSSTTQARSPEVLEGTWERTDYVSQWKQHTLDRLVIEPHAQAGVWAYHWQRWVTQDPEGYVTGLDLTEPVWWARGRIQVHYSAERGVFIVQEVRLEEQGWHTFFEQYEVQSARVGILEGVAWVWEDYLRIWGQDFERKGGA